MNKIFVAFVYPLAICPPDGADPRDFKQGDCVGSFAHKLKAQRMVELTSKDSGPPPTWVIGLHSALRRGEVKFLMTADKPATYFGYVECVKFDRRERERRVPAVADQRPGWDRPPPVEG